MHVVRFLKSDHSEPPGGRLNFQQNLVSAVKDPQHMCTQVSQKLLDGIQWGLAQQLCKRWCQCTLFNYENRIIQSPVVEDWIWCKKLVSSGRTPNTCARQFLRNCEAEFNDSSCNNCIEGVVSASCSILKIRSFRAPWLKIEFLPKMGSHQA